MSFVQRDYLLRIIEQLGDVLGYVLNLRRGGSFQEARLHIDQSIGRLIGIDPERVANASAAELVAEIRAGLERHKHPQLVSDQLVVLAGLLHESAHVYDDEGEPELATTDRLKALTLYAEVLTVEEPGSLPAGSGLGAILSELPEDPPLDIMRRLVRVYELAGRYDAAEDWLFHVLDASDDPHLLDEGIAFYQRLLALEDGALAAAGLPTDEVSAGLAELLERQAHGGG